MKRKLIEVALPLETINRESAHEKSVPRKGHPATLHLWWARRPLAAARAMLFAQLVDDPSSRPSEFPTDDKQRSERERLHALLGRLAAWENMRDERLLVEARAEILRSCDGSPPPILDPFAGGGTIPLEAQRLGLQVYASDLNPVAVLINKALLEIPPKFRDESPVFPNLAASEVTNWKGTAGLASDVRAYGVWMRDEAEKRLGHLYPKAVLSDGSQATVIGWIWARTVKCPNPGCSIQLPLVKSWWLGKKKGREAYVVPSIVDDSDDPSGLRVEFSIGHDQATAPTAGDDGTVGRTGAQCVNCLSAFDFKHIRHEASAGRMGQRLMAVVAEGSRRRVYCNPTAEHERAAAVDRPANLPDAPLPSQALGFRVQAYGMHTWVDLFTSRQLATLTTFSDLVGEARELVLRDALAAGIPEGKRLEAGGDGAAAYADAVATYLAYLGSKLADWLSAMCSWIPQIEGVRDTFARQAISMVWDFVEIHPFSNSVGNATGHFDWIVAAIENLPLDGGSATARQADAATRETSGLLIATDPPYYDNIGYSDLSDFFYVWLRRSLHSVHPELLSTVLVPKAQELVANPFRHDGRDGARDFFEDGFRRVFANAQKTASPQYPIVVWYAFKQSDNSDEGIASSGWETLLEGMIRSGWTITATWPNRSERSGRMRDLASNALASSIVIALRPRSADAPTTDRRGLISTLQTELPDALRRLQQGAIAPVDLPQAAIGPGMAVFSRYAKVLEPDGSQMTVRSALARINEILDQVLSEQEGDFDSTTRFAIAWYRQHGYSTGAFGDADSLARARNTSVGRMERDEILTSRAGKVTLVKPSDTPVAYDVLADDHTSSWEALHHAIRILETDGVPAAGVFIATAQSRPDGAVDLDLVKELAFLLFSIAEKNGWTKDALSFNAFAQSWSDVVDASKAAPGRDIQGELDYSEEDY